MQGLDPELNPSTHALHDVSFGSSASMESHQRGTVPDQDEKDGWDKLLEE